MMSENPTYSEILMDVFKPSALVTAGRWIGKNGNHVTAGVPAVALAAQSFSQRQLDCVNDEPGERLQAIRLGYGEAELGGTIPDLSFVTYDAVSAKTVVADATTPSAQIVGFMPKGGVAGDRRAVLVMALFTARVAGAAIADLAGGSVLEDHRLKINAILALLRTRGEIVP